MQDLLAEVNLQHHCSAFSCTDTGSIAVRQEREESGVLWAIVNHLDDTQFLVNTLGFHNAKYIDSLIAGHFDSQQVIIPPSTYADTRREAAAYMRESRATLQSNLASDEHNKVKGTITHDYIYICDWMLYGGLVIGDTSNTLDTVDQEATGHETGQERMSGQGQGRGRGRGLKHGRGRGHGHGHGRRHGHGQGCKQGQTIQATESADKQGAIPPSEKGKQRESSPEDEDWEECDEELIGVVPAVQDAIEQPVAGTSGTSNSHPQYVRQFEHDHMFQPGHVYPQFAPVLRKSNPTYFAVITLKPAFQHSHQVGHTHGVMNTSVFTSSSLQPTSRPGPRHHFGTRPRD
jgi:hypothetical protein